MTAQTPQYCIRLGSDDGTIRRVTPRAYLAALKLAQANPTAIFCESFASSWIPATGAEIVREHYEMLHRRWAAWDAKGKGNRAARRAQALRDASATCKWCGCPIPTARQKFCDVSCAHAYSGH